MKKQQTVSREAPVPMWLDTARDLVSCLERGDEAQADSILQELARQRDASLFAELGRLTRQIHDALTGVQADARLSELAQGELPDAKLRLSHVLELTERAAHTTIEAVERLMPLTGSLGAEAAAVANGCLNEVLMAQSYQDISGQILKRVIGLVEEVETALVNLLRVTHQGVHKVEEQASVDGPVVPGIEDASRANGQDEVDALLSSLGF